MQTRTAHLNVTKTAIGYVRVSTQEQATEGVSLDAQRDKLRAYCKANDIKLIDISAHHGLCRLSWELRVFVWYYVVWYKLRGTRICAQTHRSCRLASHATRTIFDLALCRKRLLGAHYSLSLLGLPGHQDGSDKLFCFLYQQSKRMTGRVAGMPGSLEGRCDSKSRRQLSYFPVGIPARVLSNPPVIVPTSKNL